MLRDKNQSSVRKRRERSDGEETVATLNRMVIEKLKGFNESERSERALWLTMAMERKC